MAADYDALQGFTTFLTGAALAFLGVSGNLAVGSVFIACSAAVGQGYYYKKYGKAHSDPQTMWATVGVGLIWVFASLAGVLVDRWASVPIAVGALVSGLFLIMYDRVQYRHVGPTWIHWAVIVALVVISPIPMLAGWGSPDWLWRYSIVAIGLAMFVRGLVDHFRLTKAMGSVPEQDQGTVSRTEDLDDE